MRLSRTRQQGQTMAITFLSRPCFEFINILCYLFYFSSWNKCNIDVNIATRFQNFVFCYKLNNLALLSRGSSQIQATKIRKITRKIQKNELMRKKRNDHPNQISRAGKNVRCEGEKLSNFSERNTHFSCSLHL